MSYQDADKGVRTNTTICLGRIAQYLSDDTRKRVLLSAFARSLKDPFPPARKAGLMSMTATLEYYSPSDIVGRVLPAVSIALVDVVYSVRSEGFKCMKNILSKLEEKSEV